MSPFPTTTIQVPDLAEHEDCHWQAAEIETDEVETKGWVMLNYTLDANKGHKLRLYLSPGGACLFTSSAKANGFVIDSSGAGGVQQKSKGEVKDELPFEAPKGEKCVIM